MGNALGKEDEDFQFGLRIMGMENNSPLLHECALYEDFIREINGFKNMRYIKQHPELILGSGKAWKLKIYNIIHNEEREITVEVNDTDILSVEEKLGIRY